jgi:phosphoketolase
MAQKGQPVAQPSSRKSTAPAPREGNAQNPLSADLLRKMDAYWRAANYLSVGQIYLFDNPLLEEPLQLKHIKPRPARRHGRG